METSQRTRLASSLCYINSVAILVLAIWTYHEVSAHKVILRDWAKKTASYAAVQKTTFLRSEPRERYGNMLAKAQEGALLRLHPIAKATDAKKSAYLPVTFILRGVSYSGYVLADRVKPVSASDVEFIKAGSLIIEGLTDQLLDAVRGAGMHSIGLFLGVSPHAKQKLYRVLTDAFHGLGRAGKVATTELQSFAADQSYAICQEKQIDGVISVVEDGDMLRLDLFQINGHNQFTTFVKLDHIE